MTAPTRDVLLNWRRYFTPLMVRGRLRGAEFINYIDWKRVRIAMRAEFKDAERHWAAVSANQNIAKCRG